ncbi:MAG: TRAP transporter small permease [Betaproteobacteria bacterium]|nr:TRAP transporter small permease [Betaproteobacteria bacterium]
MTEQAASIGRPADLVGRLLFDVTRIVALAGGCVLALMAAMIAVSVTGRSFLRAPIPGDFELVEIGLSVAVFTFLPYCQMVRGNVIVDFFMARAPVRAKAFFDAIGNLMFTVIVALLLWRHSLGSLDIYNAGETTMILSVPRWWSFPAAVLSLALLLAVCLYTLWRSIREMRAGRFE